ncbi:hypothetical protein MJO28_011777 [Puccinia striiformis f. sp. tritici]|uniref:F-actin-capping protein subunit alpha n=2 Tax=Puccinia striiformis TaxID=27350 RepID=A0A2S4UQH5_9BASI|nr:hypothetical protein Pst134EA_033062 [Puccinia striiformis f. sp. tritici]KAH9457478.1 hypothetical protein Pst134EA_033062 [Puccinia striiformis f. sp. tritici]KAI7944249.1 hypothetical protein MJO28_011777 [Puccinia striiformis f. sp. tritici]KAI9617645.1 hypothetical protein H4Q26_012948 [Puccinia striiformis f. sp. tritici PST-130]POV99565.1 hypothetical protein PSTT_13703 [Puccinia striiformis]
MQEASLKDRLAVASALILQSPPGEVNDVFNDVRPIVGDDSELERGLLPALAQYNTEQLTLVELPNAKIPAMICPAARIDQPGPEQEEGKIRYLDPHSQQTFIFDHLRLTASEITTYTPPDQEQEKLRLGLDKQAESYVKNHFQNAVWSVFSSPQEPESVIQQDSVDQTASGSDQPVESSNQSEITPDVHPSSPPIEDQESPEQSSAIVTDTEDHNSASPTSSSPSNKFKLYIVGNKYNPTNYWTGRWRSIYEIDMSSGTIKGEIQVNVHYYEQGNVQLSTNHSPEIEPISTTNTKKVIEPEEIMKVIQIAESKYQASLNSAYTDLGENTFKQLRRALPVTKQKVNWMNMKSKIVLDDH